MVSSAFAASTGSLSGTVTDAVTHAPLAYVCVTAYDVSNPLAISISTDSLGHYTLPGLAAGTYKVGFQACGGGNYQSQYYNGKPTLATADPVVVGSDSTTSGIDAALVPGGQITGTVTNATTGAPVAGECVAASGPNNSLGGFATTDTAGHYTISGLAAGTYTVAFNSCSGGGNYLPQYYNNKSTQGNADPVSVTAGATASGIDAALQPGGQITGTVTNATTGAPLAGVCVNAYGTNNTPGGFASTDSSGHYTISGLAAGSYSVAFRSCGSGGNYVTQYYNDKSSPSTADAVAVTAGDTASGIDAALQPGGQITGTVTNAITGAPIANICVGVYDASNTFAAMASTDSAGHYSASGLADGQYKVAFGACTVDGNYLPQYYNNKPAIGAADPVSVTAGATTSGIDAALQPGGQITGTVTNATTGAPIARACVVVYGTSNNSLAYGYTNDSGDYSVRGLAAGRYTVQFDDCGRDNYVRQFYDDKLSQTSADQVSVTAGGTTSGIDAALEPPGQITGMVTDAKTGDPAAHACVRVYDTDGTYMFFVTTDVTGHYSVPGVAGHFKLEFQACGSGNYAPQYYSDKPTLAAADIVTVSGGATTSGIDAALTPGGQITGTVTDALTHGPISGACVGAYDTSDHLLTYTQTNAEGTYTLASLATGRYKVGFASGGSLCPIGPGDYQPQLYDGQTAFATADLVSVTAGTTTSGIDAALQPTGDTPPNTPSAPTSNQAVNNDGGQTLSWSAVTDPDGDSIDHYVVQHERSDQTTFSDVATVTGTSYRFGADGPSEGEGTWTYRIVAVDARGTSSTPSDPSAPVVVDKSPPNPPSGHTAPSPSYVDSATGQRWYRDSVTVSFSANGDPALSDGSPGSGVASVTAAKTFDSADVDSRTGAFSQDGTATDHAGNVSSATTVNGNIDWTAPSASFSGCPRSHVILNSAHTVVWTATDPAPSSGLATAPTGSVLLDTGHVGAHTVRSPAPTDNVGHTGSAASCAYTVDYAFSGFDEPVKDPPHVNDVNPGRGIPLKWQLTDAAGKNIGALSAVTSITYKPTGCNSFTTDPAGGSHASAAGGTSLRYDAGAHQYIFNWKTPGAGCYSLFLTLDSGQVEPAYIRVIDIGRAPSLPARVPQRDKGWREPARQRAHLTP